jgi:hypothetical protein
VNFKNSPIFADFCLFLPIFAYFCLFLPIFADFSRFFSRGNRVDNVSQVPGGFEGANLGKYFSKILINFFNPKKNSSPKKFMLKKKIQKIGSPPPLCILLFLNIFGQYSRILEGY